MPVFDFKSPAIALPSEPRPIVVIGAGGIVRDAHLPAYAKAGFEVTGIYDLDRERASTLATQFDIAAVYDALPQAVASAPPDIVFDVAVPAKAIPGVLRQLPDGAAVLIQKPLGENLEGARAIREICHAKKLVAAVNFQLRFSPQVMAARSLLDSGALGELCDLEIRMVVDTPWRLWTFLEGLPRVEILYHSVHYLDLVRSFWGEPQGVYARTLMHPRSEKLASTRTAIILDYGDLRRAVITVNHDHGFGARHQESYIKWEGTRGAAKATMGLLLNYPQGEPDAFEWCALDENDAPGEWQNVALEGSWFPDAFIGTMSSLQRFASGESDELPTSVEDAFRTMALVEVCYQSNEQGATPLPDFSSYD